MHAYPIHAYPIHAYFHNFCGKPNLTRNCNFVELRGNYNTVRKPWVRAFICYCSLALALRNVSFRLNLLFGKVEKSCTSASSTFSTFPKSRKKLY